MGFVPAEKVFCKNCKHSRDWEGLTVCIEHDIVCLKNDQYRRICRNYRSKKEKEPLLVIVMKEIIEKEKIKNERNFKFSGF